MSDQKPMPDKNGSTAGNNKISRRLVIGGIAAATTAVLVKQFGGNMVQTAVPEDPALLHDPTKVQGPLPSALGSRSPFEKPVRKPSPTSSRTPLQDLYGTITPS